MSERIRIGNCSVARTLEVAADPWTFLIMREAYFGIRRFDRMRERLGVPRGTLAARLSHIVAQGLMQRVRYQSAPERFEYRLTARGADLYPSMVTLMGWGDRWRAGPEGPPLVLVHNPCGRTCSTVVVCSECGGTILPRDVSYRDGPAAGIDHEYPRVNTRRLSRPENFLRGRPCSVARTLEVIGDRWTFLLIRQAFLGVHRFEKVRRTLGISTNILADRLQRLVEFGIFDRRLYSTTPARHEYRFTDKGRDLYPSMIALMRWGDDWLWEDAGVPMILHHKPCGRDFRPLVVCTECHGEIAIRDMSYRPGPGADPAAREADADLGSGAGAVAGAGA